MRLHRADSTERTCVASSLADPHSGGRDLLDIGDLDCGVCERRKEEEKEGG